MKIGDIKIGCVFAGEVNPGYGQYFYNIVTSKRTTKKGRIQLFVTSHYKTINNEIIITENNPFSDLPLSPDTDIKHLDFINPV